VVFCVVEPRVPAGNTRLSGCQGTRLAAFVCHLKTTRTFSSGPPTFQRSECQPWLRRGTGSGEETLASTLNVEMQAVGFLDSKVKSNLTALKIPSLGV
jgi:hypothetical protein